ncbi:nitrite reductase small subunit NirD [Alcaligenaceae bacterium]|nr:nitrite reductase small subunit NirD [Alcaligenaceae bacterium]
MNTTASDNWTAVCHIDDIPKLGARVVHHQGSDPIAIFRASDNHVFAVINRCPHKGGPLSDGLVHGHTVTCPLHSWNINLEDGQACEPDTGCVRTVDVRIAEERVYLALPGLG